MTACRGAAAEYLLPESGSHFRIHLLQKEILRNQDAVCSITDLENNAKSKVGNVSI